MSDSETETVISEEVLSEAQNEPSEAPKKVKKTRAKAGPDDKRRQTSSANLQKAREAKLEKMRLRRQLEEQEFEVDSQESDGETELVVSRKPKQKVISPEEARLLKIELALQQLALQSQIKETKAKKTRTKKAEIADVMAEENKKNKEVVEAAVKDVKTALEVKKADLQREKEEQEKQRAKAEQEAKRNTVTRKLLDL